MGQSTSGTILGVVRDPTAAAILDVFSRYGAGWMVAHKENAELARQFIQETIGKHQVPVGQLNIHADRGRVMTSKPVAFLIADLGTYRPGQSRYFQGPPKKSPTHSQHS